MACVRLFTVIGPRQRPDLALPTFTRRILAGEPVVLFGDGGSERDYTWAGDIADGILAAHDRVAGYAIWNLGAGRPVRLDDLVRVLGRALGVEPRIERGARVPGDVDATLADIRNAARDLDWRPRVGWEDAVTRYVRWQAEHAAGA